MLEPFRHEELVLHSIAISSCVERHALSLALDGRNAVAMFRNCSRGHPGSKIDANEAGRHWYPIFLEAPLVQSQALVALRR